MFPERVLKIATTCVLLFAAMAVSGEVVTIELIPGAWLSEGVNKPYQDLPVHLGFGVTAVDSVRVELIGVSHLGESLIGCHPECMFVWCHQTFVAHFLNEDGTVNCQYWYATYDDRDLPVCVGAGFAPPGDLQPFDLESKITGLSARSGPNEAVYAITDDHPDLGALFADGEAILRLRPMNGSNTGNRCFNGLAELSQVSVHVYFDSALAIENSTWGSIKAWYR